MEKIDGQNSIQYKHFQIENNEKMFAFLSVCHVQTIKCVRWIKTIYYTTTILTAHLFCLLFIFLVFKILFRSTLCTINTKNISFLFFSFFTHTPPFLSLVCYLYGNVQFAYLVLHCSASFILLTSFLCNSFFICFLFILHIFFSFR